MTKNSNMQKMYNTQSHKPEFLLENPYPYYKDRNRAWQEGSEDTFKSLMKCLFEPCTEHWIQVGICNEHPTHRYLCFQCMQELKEWSEKL